MIAFSTLDRGFARRVLIFPQKLVLDTFLWCAAPLAAYLLRFDGSIPMQYLAGLAWLTGLGAVLKVAALITFRLNLQAWRHASFRDSVAVARAVMTVGVAEVVLGLAIATRLPLPRSVLPLSILLGVVALFGVRAAARFIHARKLCPLTVYPKEGVRQALIIGAGEAGHMVVRELNRHPQAGLVAGAILDDDPAKYGMLVDGVPVVGDVGTLGAVLRQWRFDQVVIAIASADGTLIRRVREQVSEFDTELPVRVIPGVYEVLAGDVSTSRLRDVRIEDLLRRPPVPIDLGPVLAYVEGRTVLVTGAGGSIGSELVRQLVRCRPKRIIAMGHGENSIFELVQEIQRLGAPVSVVPIIASIRDPASMRAVFARYRPQAVFHAAAHKHLPLLETNPEQGVFNNVLGTRNVVEQALHSNVERLVSISTDKAVNPSSILGATKRLAECLVKDAAERAGPGQMFTSVRFGNVLGSRGSAVRVFRQQIERGGPITVTHPEMTRYFMTIPEACQLVLQAGALGENGTTFLLDMGRPVKIVALAEELIRLSGLRPHEDIEIVYTGVRPGEKMHEELLTRFETGIPTRHPHIRAATGDDMRSEALARTVELLREAASAGRSDAVRQLLRQVVPPAVAAD